MSESYGVTVVLSRMQDVTVRAATSIVSTVPCTTRALGWRRRMSRVGGAISPSDRIPVATW